MSVLRKRTYLPADERRAQILDVAKRVFAARSYRDANVAHICEAARIGRGTLYQYFESKRDVLHALLEEIAGRVERVLSSRPRVASMRGVGSVPVPMIVDFCQKRLQATLEAIFEDEATLRLVLREAHGADPGIDELLTRIDDRLLAAIEDDLRAAQKAGVLRRGRPRLMARFLLGGVEKMVLAALAEEAPVDLKTIVEQAVDIELFGLLSDEHR